MQLLDASKAHARDLANLINLAGEGLPEILWRSIAEPGETPMDVGTRYAAQEEGRFSYRHARICVKDDRVVGALVAYRQPDPYETSCFEASLPAARPLFELEARAPGSWYINALATLPEQYGHGVGRALMADTLTRAREAGCTQASLIVASENHRAMRVYQQLGFAATARLAVVPFATAKHGGEWVLMMRALGNDDDEDGL